MAAAFWLTAHSLTAGCFAAVAVAIGAFEMTGFPETRSTVLSHAFDRHFHALGMLVEG